MSVPMAHSTQHPACYGEFSCSLASVWTSVWEKLDLFVFFLMHTGMSMVAGFVLIVLFATREM